jgi:hypothetical protein
VLGRVPDRVLTTDLLLSCHHTVSSSSVRKPLVVHSTCISWERPSKLDTLNLPFTLCHSTPSIAAAMHTNQTTSFLSGHLSNLHRVQLDVTPIDSTVVPDFFFFLVLLYCIVRGRGSRPKKSSIASTQMNPFCPSNLEVEGIHTESSSALECFMLHKIPLQFACSASLMLPAAFPILGDM